MRFHFWQGCALCVAAFHRAVCSPRSCVLGKQPHEEIVGLFGELAVAAFLHHTRVPWVIDALLDVQGVLPVRPHQVQRLFCSLRLLMDW